MHSAHVFIFPFKWRAYHPNNRTPFRDKVQLASVQSAIAKQPNWIPFKFQPKPEAEYFNSYNEYAYFHDYARDVLGVNYKAPEDTSSVVMAQYEYQLFDKSAQYIIALKSGVTYSLQITSITLNLYESGVGALAYHLQNNKHDYFEDILKINDFGRRIYPQYLGGLADERTINNKGEPQKSSLLSSPQGNFMPTQITLEGIENEPIVENFCHYDTRANILDTPFVLPAHIGRLLGPFFKTSFEPKQSGDIIIQPVLDDRMFLLSFVFQDTLISKLSQYDEDNSQYTWENDSDWYRLVFVDGSSTPTIDSRNMKRDLLRASTYDRWIETQNDGSPVGHIFGISRYSFVIAANRNWFTENIIMQHFSNLYFQMVLLTLVQRATILSFSAEAVWIADHLPKAKGLKTRTIDNIADLYLHYMKFIQKIYFREITPQEQGIELYNLLQDRLHIKTNVEDLDREMSELNQFVEAQQQRNISLITYWFFPAGLVLALFGLNYFGTEGLYFNLKDTFLFDNNVYSVIVIIVVTVLLTLLVNRLLRLVI